MVQKWMFLLFVHGQFSFHLFLMMSIFNEFLGKFLSEKYISLLCTCNYKMYYHFCHKRVKFRIFNFFGI